MRLRPAMTLFLFQITKGTSVQGQMWALESLYSNKWVNCIYTSKIQTQTYLCLLPVITRLHVSTCSAVFHLSQLTDFIFHFLFLLRAAVPCTCYGDEFLRVLLSLVCSKWINIILIMVTTSWGQNLCFCVLMLFFHPPMFTHVCFVPTCNSHKSIIHTNPFFSHCHVFVWTWTESSMK